MLTKMKSMIAAAAVAALAVSGLAYSSPVAAVTANPCSFTGDGSAGAPFEIATQAHLECLRDNDSDYVAAGLNFKQTADITMTSTWSRGIGPVWYSSAPFRGTYDGNGHSIADFSLVTTSDAGLFRQFGGVIKNLRMTNATVTGSGTAAGIVAAWAYNANQAVTFQNLSVQGSVTGTEVRTGGVVGALENGAAMSNVYADVNVTCTKDSANNFCGGVAGNGSIQMTKILSRSIVTAPASAKVGAISGAANSDITYSFFDTTSPRPTAPSAGGQLPTVYGKTTAELQDRAIYTAAGWNIADGWSASTVWSICSSVNNGLPFLSIFSTTNPCSAGYTADGYFQPVDTGGTLNTVKGGSVIPLKFIVHDGEALMTDPTKVTFVVDQINCAATSTVIADAIEYTVAGSTSLRWDGTQFIQNWRIPTGRDKCYRVTHTANATAAGPASSTATNTVTAIFKTR